ncbi:hypothetical protein G6F35_009403 [Rhizopus arrhizus]|nr:hypothetical protein G6F35_009403 [Rhizopus arrhizus]
MATYQPLEPQAPWRQLTVEAKDWQQADPALLGTMLTQLHWIRAFEEAVLDLAAEGLVLAVLLLGGWLLLRPEPAIAFAERDWVVLADVDNLTAVAVRERAVRGQGPREPGDGPAFGRYPAEPGYRSRRGSARRRAGRAVADRAAEDRRLRAGHRRRRTG